MFARILFSIVGLVVTILVAAWFANSVATFCMEKTDTFLEALPR